MTWTLEMRSDKLVELKVVDSICPETVRQAPKKRDQAVAEGAVVHPAGGRRRVRVRDGGRAGGVPPAGRPQVPAEASKPLVGEVVQPTPAAPGQPERFDYEYVRNGAANLFMISEPLAGWRYVMVTQRRTAKDFAEILRWRAEDVYPGAEKVVLVMDNGNTHELASLYEAFEPEHARRLAERFEVHQTPKHGSWRNVAEIELSVLARQCLDRRIESADALLQELEPWEGSGTAGRSG